MSFAADVAPVLVLAALGLAVGSFLNVVIWRVPRGESVVSPPSACPDCGAFIAWHDNVPVLGWLALGGRCRNCGGRISIRYPLVEVLTAALFVGMWAALGWQWSLPAFLYLAAVGVALALIDMDVKRLPNSLVLPSYVVALVLFLLPAAMDGEWNAYLRALLGGAALFVGYLAIALAAPKGMGMGDVKLSGVLGIYLGWLGWPVLAVGAFLGFFLGGVLGTLLIASRVASRKTKIPFGPFMLLGAVVAVFCGNVLADAYSGLITGS